MKKTTLLSLLLSTTLLFAQEGDLVVFTTDGAKLHLALDNKFQNKKASTYVKITDIPEGNYWVTLMFDDERKAMKSNIRVLGNNENSFIVEKDGDSWKLKTYSSVPRNQVNSAIGSHMVIAYNNAGITLDRMHSANDLAKSEVEHEQQVARQGTQNDSRYQEGTTSVKCYIKTDNPDGSISIIEKVTTTTKTLVDRNGQKQMRTRRSIALTPTNFTCLPMEQAQFKVLLNKAKGLQEAERLQFLQRDLNQQCLAPNQIKMLSDLFEENENRQLFAQIALPTHAEPNKSPYETKDITVVDPTIEAIEEVVPEEAAFPSEASTEPLKEENEAAKEVEKKVETVVEKTKAQMRSEKRQAKIEARIAKKTAKAKEHAEKKAAREKAKRTKNK